MSLDKDIESLLQKHLPAHVGETLSKELEDYRELKKAHQQLRIINSNYLERITALENEVKSLSHLKEREELITSLEWDVQERERALKLTILEAKCSNIETNHSKLLELVGVIFKNPIVRETISKSEPMLVNGYPQVQSAFVNKTVTTE